ncbi:MAG TPA: hypothetical protein VIG53_06345 [Actinomycetota bacterium]|jgi:hypothetical protein
MTRRTSVIAAVTTLALLVPVVASAGPRVPTWVTRARGASSGAGRVAPAAGPGSSISRDDGDDTQGALDLRSMKITRGGAKDTIVFTNDTAVSNTDIDPDNGNFAVLIDRNDDRTFDFGQYVYFYAGKLRGVLVNLRTNRAVDRTAPVARVNTRTFRTVIQRSKVDSPGTYRFAVFSYSEAAPCTRKNACVDALPNRYPLIPLDHEAPSVNVTNLASFANDASSTLSTDLDVAVSDDPHGTGVKSWIVQRKQVGTTGGWQQVAKGRTKNTTVSLSGDEGATYQVRVIVVDRQENKQVSSIERTTFAVDDRDGSVFYGGTAIESSSVGAFLATVTSVGAGGTATFSFTGGSSVCVMGGPIPSGPQAASVTATLDTVSVSVGVETDGTDVRGRTGCVPVPGSGAHSLELTVDSTPGYVVDGFYVLP